MGINFPDSPTVGQQYPVPAVAGQPVWQWDGEKWTAGVPAIGDGAVRYDIVQALTNAQKIQARQNIGVPAGVRDINTAGQSLDASDYGKTIAMAGTITIAIAAGATLSTGWFVDVWNYSTGIINIDPNGSETIDGVATAAVWPAERMRILWTGTQFITLHHAGLWQTWTPTTLGSGGGSYASGGATALKFKKVRDSVMLAGQFDIVSLGSATGFVQLGLPLTSVGVGGGASAIEQNINGKTATGAIAGGYVVFRYYDNSTPLVAGTRYIMHGSYECQK